MRLEKADITNFRSIKELTIEFSPRCRILVGKNEGGKTNIISALSFLDPSKEADPGDVREPMPRERPVRSANVRFHFRFDETDAATILESIEDTIAGSLDAPLLKTPKKAKLSMTDFCLDRSSAVYIAGILGAGSRYTYWTLPAGYSVLPRWRKPADDCPASVSVLVDGRSVPLKDLLLIDTELVDVDEAHLEPVDAEYVNDILGREQVAFLKEHAPATLVWQYQPSLILPGSVTLSSFAAKPDSCLPLTEMFRLAGIRDVAEAVKEATTGSKHGLRNLLSRVAKATTKYFRRVWPEYKEIEFCLSPNGDEIDIAVKDTFNEYEFEQRSDGFKRFVSFLLLVAAKAHNKDLSNTLLLIDEPEIGLHPSGARYLCRELRKLSEKNYVVYATHSIFMIDRDGIDRHLIVTKSREATATARADEGNLVDEEVLCRALGFTFFESLRPRNIVFEGWNDKELFRVALAHLRSEHRPALRGLQEVGCCHANGAKDVKRWTPLLELAGRHCLIVSDADEPAREQQRQHQRNNAYGEWLRYDEIQPGCNVTGEDFLRPEALHQAIETASAEHHQLAELRLEDLIEGGRMARINAWLRKGGMEGDARAEFVARLKEAIYSSLTAKDIAESYYAFLGALEEKLNRPAS